MDHVTRFQDVVDGEGEDTWKRVKDNMIRKMKTWCSKGEGKGDNEADGVVDFLEKLDIRTGVTFVEEDTN